MKVLLLNSVDTSGGAARAALRLNLGLRKAGIDAQIVVQKKVSDENSIIGPCTFLQRWIADLRPHLDALPVCLYPRRNRNIFSPAQLPERLTKKVAAFAPDVIHFHWICEGFVRLESLRKFRKPLIWTLHDSWAFTGGCHLPFDCTRYRNACGSCPTLGSSSQMDLSSWIWQRKHAVFRELDITFVAPSRWLAECARSSSLLRNAQIEIIPNGVDLQRFRPHDKVVARAILGLPQNKRLILFNSLGGVENLNKGFHFLVSALQILISKGLDHEIELVIMGSSLPIGGVDTGVQTHCFGKLSDEISIALLYAAADVSVVPSIQENLPNTVLESMACGTPSVAFRIGGLPELIDHLQNGYLALPYDDGDLAKGIAWALENETDSLILSNEARSKIVTKFSQESMIEKYLTLYGKVTGSGKNHTS